MFKINGSSYYKECLNCPYYNQVHLADNDKKVREFIPLKLEDNNSNVLIVLQAPGSEEWESGKALQSNKKPGGTAGVRVLNSWERKKKARTDFDIVEAVRCYPGEGANGRDNEPEKQAKACCSKILAREINSKKYSTIIVFGSPAKEVIGMTMKNINIENKFTVIFAKHPNGGLTNDIADTLW